MNRILVDPFGVDEQRKVDYDFAAWIPVGVTISSSTAVSSVYSGTDSTPDIVNGSTSNSGTIVTVTLGGSTKKGSVGVIYDVLVTATLSDSQVIPMASYVAFVPDLI